VELKIIDCNDYDNFMHDYWEHAEDYAPTITDYLQKCGFRSIVFMNGARWQISDEEYTWFILKWG
jgi:hypothetical protein